MSLQLQPFRALAKKKSGPVTLFMSKNYCCHKDIFCDVTPWISRIANASIDDAEVCLDLPTGSSVHFYGL